MDLDTIITNMNMIKTKYPILNKYKKVLYTSYTFMKIITLSEGYDLEKLTGKRIFITDNKITTEQNLINGQFHGSQFDFFESGKTKVEKKYHEGSLKEEITYWESGKKLRIYKFVNDKRHGESVEYNSDENIIGFCNYYDDQFHGSFLTFYSTGEILKRSTYEHGKFKNGFHYSYRINGLIETMMETKDGLITKKTEYDDTGARMKIELYENGVLKTITIRENGVFGGTVYVTYNSKEFEALKRTSTSEGFGTHVSGTITSGTPVFRSGTTTGGTPAFGSEITTGGTLAFGSGTITSGTPVFRSGTTTSGGFGAPASGTTTNGCFTFGASTSKSSDKSQSRKVRFSDEEKREMSQNKDKKLRTL